MESIHRTPLQCVYPETRRFDTAPPESTQWATGRGASTGLSDDMSLWLQGSSVQRYDHHLSGIDRTLPEIRGYLEGKGYDRDPDQASQLAYMSAVLRTTKVSQYFFEREEPWMLLRELCDGEEELHCVRRLGSFDPASAANIIGILDYPDQSCLQLYTISARDRRE